ncbi:7899_t:CDS:10 [Diversispora eburnea]|uniref:7899_t:CDS:1 n=1 Tax=Diversispora eburnea TaxID=1213867 RepID=A0A9N9BTQ0_9GLOM|nr:7899_t:CDS:10 [Diversispora eburnea]
MDKSEDIIRALQSRLLLRKSFLLALMHMAQPINQQYSQAQHHLPICLQLLNDSKGDGICVSNTIDLGVEVEGAFDPLINRKLVSQTPPRPIRLLSMQEAIDELKNMLKNLIEICNIIDYKSATSLTNFMIYYSAKQSIPCAFSRSFLQSTVYSENRILGKLSVYQLIKDSVTELTNPPYIYFASKTDIGTSFNGSHIDIDTAKISKLIHTFVDNAVKPLTDYFRILCHNRSRQQRNMCKVLSDWDLLQDEAEHIDTELQSIIKEEPLPSEEGPSYAFHLSSWVYHRKLILLEDILFLGFELGLFGDHEFVMIYWYLDYILGVHYQHLERTHMHVTDHRKFKKQQNYFQFESSLQSSAVSLIVSQQVLTMARQDICRGIHRTIIALQKTGNYTPPKLEFDDESIRFWHRFRMYRSLGSPTILSFQDFKDITRLDNITALELLSFSLKNFQSARSSIENLLAIKPSESRMDFCHTEFTKDLQAMLRVCIANIISLHKILEEFDQKPITMEKIENEKTKKSRNKKGNKNKRKQKPPQKPPQNQKPMITPPENKLVNRVANFEFKYHPWFPVITLK